MELSQVTRGSLFCSLIMKRQLCIMALETWHAFAKHGGFERSTKKPGPRTLKQFDSKPHVWIVGVTLWPWRGGALGFIWSPGLHLWSSTSRQSWSPEQRHSGARAQTPAPPRRELPAGPAGSPKWKPSLRSKKKANIRIRPVQYWQPLEQPFVKGCLDQWECEAARPYLITDSGGNVAHLHPAGLSDADASPVEVSDADVHPWANRRAEMNTV